MEAERFGYKDIEEFTHFFRNEMDKLTDKISKEEIISPDRILEIIEKQGGIAKPREFFIHMHEAGVAIKKALLAEGKNPRTYVNAMADFLNKWLDTVNDNSYINVASKYYQQRRQQNRQTRNRRVRPIKNH